MSAPAPPNPPLGGSWGALKRSQSGLGAFLAALGDVLGLQGSLPGGSEATLGADVGRYLYGASLGCEKRHDFDYFQLVFCKLL